MKARAPRDDLAAEYVRSILDYDPETGVLTWCERREGPPNWNARFVGCQAGTVRLSRGRPYVRISINAKRYSAHRLAVLYVTGDWPMGTVDHRDGDGLNNRWSNLRAATQSQNNANVAVRTTSGLKGVYSHGKRWQAAITVAGKKRHLGTYDIPEDASVAYLEAAKVAFGFDFARAA